MAIKQETTMIKKHLALNTWLLSLFLVLIPVKILKADIVIGVAGPYTGLYAKFGAQMWEGAEQASKDINTKGFLKEQIRLVKADDACDPEQATLVAKRLVDFYKVNL